VVSDELSRAEARLLELEVRYTHQNETIEHMSDVIYQQQQLIDKLTERVRLLEEKAVGLGAPEQPRNLEDEVPPHY
jgi:SlyX protein